MPTVITASTEIDPEDPGVARKEPKDTMPKESLRKLVDQACAEASGPDSLPNQPRHRPPAILCGRCAPMAIEKGTSSGLQGARTGFSTVPLPWVVPVHRASSTQFLGDYLL